MKKQILDLIKVELSVKSTSFKVSFLQCWPSTCTCSLWFSDSSLGSQTFCTPCFKVMGLDAELTLMYWQTIRSCGKRKEVASSLFSRIHWRKPISLIGFFRTVRIQSRGERSSIRFKWPSRKMPKFALLPVCLVCGLFHQTPCEKRTYPLSLTSPSGTPDRIFLCLLGEAHGAAGMLY